MTYAWSSGIAGPSALVAMPKAAMSGRPGRRSSAREPYSLRSIGQRLPQRRHRVTENHAGDLRPGIFEREILMPARMQFVIRDFTLHPDGAKFRLERTANGAGQLGDGEDF